MTVSARHPGRRRWVLALLAAVLAVGVGLFAAGPASALTAPAAQNGVGASTSAAQVVVGASAGVVAGQRLGNDLPQPGIVVATGVATNTARAESIVAESRTYVDLTRGGSIRNVGTNATHTEFAETLTQSGWTSRVSSDGAVQIFEQNGARYVLRQQAGSYSGWSADFAPAGSAGTTLKLRLGYE